MFKVHQLDICVKTNFHFEQTTIIQLKVNRQTNQLNSREKNTHSLLKVGQVILGNFST